jgi:hypothetical protein
MSDIDTETSWIFDAACRGMDPSVFFPSQGDVDGLNYALSVCMSCAVKTLCLDANLMEKEGIWGATTGKSRASLRREATIDLECKWCFKSFEREVPNQVFCSDECRACARRMSRSKSKAAKR